MCEKLYSQALNGILSGISIKSLSVNKAYTDCETDFASEVDDLTQAYFVYVKENQRGMAQNMAASRARLIYE